MTARTPGAASRQRGFTLLEVLVATVIAALALGVLIHGALASIRSVQVSGQYEEALSRARSHLAAFDAEDAPTAGEHEGDDGRGFHWRVRAVALASAPIARGDAAAQGQGPRVVLLAVTVIVAWQDENGGTREVRLASEQVGAAPPAPSMTTRDQAGFTLLEILAALVVLGFLIVGLSEGTRFGLQAWHMQTRVIGGRGELDAVDRTMRTLVAQMDPGSATRDSTLRGTATRVAFSSDLPDGAPASDTRRADMLLAVDAMHTLVLMWTPHLHATRLGAAPPPKKEALLRDIDRIELSYWRSDTGTWQTAWSDRDLPGLIRMRILFPAGDPRRWPDIVAAPALDRQG